MALARFLVVIEDDRGRVVEEVPRFCDAGIPAADDTVQVKGALYRVDRRLFVDDDEEKKTTRTYMLPRLFVRRAWTGKPRRPTDPSDPEISTIKTGSHHGAQVIPLRDATETVAVEFHFQQLGASSEQIALFRSLRERIDFYENQRAEVARLVRVAPSLYLEGHSPERLRQLSREVKRQFTALCLELAARRSKEERTAVSSSHAA